MRKEILRIQGLNKANDGKPVLTDFFLNLYEGDVLGVIGLHDSGKSLLLRILSGKESWDTGRVYYDEAPVTYEVLSRSRAIQLVDSVPQLIPTLSVLENIFVVRSRFRRNPFIQWAKLRQQLQLCLSELDIHIDMDRLAANLTLAERHMVAIIKAYITGAKIILADNVMAQYTYAEHQMFHTLLQRLKQKKISFILTSYQLASLRGYADHLLYLVKGTTAKIYYDYDGAPIEENKILLGEVAAEKPSARYLQPDIRFEARHIATNAQEDISFQIHRGEIAVILDIPHETNMNVVNALLGKANHTGTFLLDGREITRKVLNKNVCIADYAMGDVVIQSLNLKDNLSLSAFRRISRLGFISRRQRDVIESDFVHLYETNDWVHDFRLGKLSQPETMAIYLYRILVQRWQLLICINPEMLFGYETVQKIKEQLLRMTENGRSVCIFASTIEQYADLADYYYIVEDGHVMGKFTFDELHTHYDIAKMDANQEV